MFNTTKVSTTNILSYEELQKLGASMSELLEKYRNNNKVLKLAWVIPILGRPPVIPDSPDTDARNDAYDDLVEYNRKKDFIEDILKEKL